MCVLVKALILQTFPTHTLLLSTPEAHHTLLHWLIDSIPYFIDWFSVLIDSLPYLCFQEVPSRIVNNGDPEVALQTAEETEIRPPPGSRMVPWVFTPDCFLFSHKVSIEVRAGEGERESRFLSLSCYAWLWELHNIQSSIHLSLIPFPG